MLKSTKYFVLPVTVTILCAFSFCAYDVWRKSEESAYKSCIYSVASAIQNSEARKNLFLDNSNWKILNDEETDFLMSQIQGGDCSRFDNPTLDLWNHRINIALRNSISYPEIVIWSNGRDGISRTDDDLVIPYKQSIPK